MDYGFNSRDDEDSFIDDNGDHHLANYDSQGRAYYADRRLASNPAPKAVKPRAKTTNMSTLKALAGTAKQKKWAHDIRDGFLGSTPSPELAAVFSDSWFMSAKFWIENRSMHGPWLIQQATRLVELNAEYRTSGVADGEVIRREAQRIMRELKL